MAIHGTLIKESLIDEIVRKLEIGTEFENGCTVVKVKKTGQTMMRVKIKTPSDSERSFLLRMLEEL